jgi:hypothetical protein
MTGGGLAIAIVPQLESWLGWRASYWTALVIAGAVGLALLAAPVDEARSRATGRALVVDRRLAALECIHAATFGLSVVAADWAVELLTHHSHGKRVSAIVGALFLLAGIVTRPFGGYLVRHRPKLTRRAVGLSLAVGATSTGALALPLPLGVLAFAALVGGLSAGLPLAAVFSGAARPAGRAGCRGRLRECRRGADDRGRDTARRAVVLIARKRTDRVRRDRPALGGGTARARTRGSLTTAENDPVANEVDELNHHRGASGRARLHVGRYARRCEVAGGLQRDRPARMRTARSCRHRTPDAADRDRPAIAVAGGNGVVRLL